MHVNNANIQFTIIIIVVISAGASGCFLFLFLLLICVFFLINRMVEMSEHIVFHSPVLSINLMIIVIVD